MRRRNLVVSLLLVAAALAVFAFVASGQFPYRAYAVLTGSMDPTFASKSLVVVLEDDYRAGQPITFEHNGALVTHRLVTVNPDGSATTKGDANATVDPWTVPAEAIVGGVVAAVPELGYWLVYLRNPVGLVSLGLSALVCWQIWSLAGTPTRDPHHPSTR
ncbi:signal peptidase I [Marisediminicola antarctica]|uniref:Signal peptidase I n=1 Tax=Marisediminicola antarctica TaxID=674079 RepID=A0A7L5AHZ6_9MICO|nr:signal peptidase I [Marisediminicola antarctica]QHO69014.1 signal peptidase I [Marisediminicola antarctica]